MKRFTLFALLALPFVFAGCGSDDPTSPLSDTGGTGISAADRAAIEADIATQNDLFGDLTFEEPGDGLLPYEEASVVLSPEVESPTGERPEGEDLCRRFFWFRHITSRDRLVVIEVEQQGDTLEKAHVKITTKLAGTFNIVTRNTGDDPGVRPVDGVWIKKRLRDVGRRHAIYLRRINGGEGEAGNDEALTDNRRGWHLAGLSNREIASPEHTANILKIKLETRSGLMFETEDPLALMRFPRGIPHVLPGEPIRVTAWTRDPSNAVFLYARWGRQMMRPVEGETGVFVGTLRAPEQPRFFHLGVNALTRGTLFDPVAPYDSDFWGMVVAAAPPPPAEETPAE
jgi:hypothetical protein